MSEQYPDTRRERLIQDLGLVVIVEQHLPNHPLLHEGVYDAKLDELRMETERQIAIRQAIREGKTVWGNLIIETGEV